MRLRKAHNNSRLAPIRRKRREKREEDRKRAKVGWRQWLETLGPDYFLQNMIHEDSLVGRLLKGAKVNRGEMLNYRGKIMFPRLPTAELPEPPDGYTVSTPALTYIIVDDFD